MYFVDSGHLRCEVLIKVITNKTRELQVLWHDCRLKKRYVYVFTKKNSTNAYSVCMKSTQVGLTKEFDHIHLRWLLQMCKFISDNNQITKTCRAFMAAFWKRRSATWSCPISRTRRWNGSFFTDNLMVLLKNKCIILFEFYLTWFFRICRKAFVPKLFG